MKKIRTKFLTALAAAVVGGGLFASSAAAIVYFPPVTGFQDDDLEWHADTGTPCTGTTNCTDGIVPGTAGNGLIDVGERIYGVLEFINTKQIPSGGTANIPPNEELSGVFDTTVLTKTQVAPGVFAFTFGPSGAAGVLGGQAAGTMVSLYLDNVDDINVDAATCTSDVNCIDLANNGNLYMDIGFNGDVNNLWIAPGATDSTAAVKATGASTAIGNFQYFLNILTNNTGQTFTPQTCNVGIAQCAPGGDNAVQVIGSGSILGGAGLTNGAFARSDTDAEVQTVPEPSTLLLLGSGLLGISFFSRRRKKK